MKPFGFASGAAAPALLLLSTVFQPTAAAAEPAEGGVINIGLIRQADCIDPQQSNYGYGSFDGRQLVDSLTDQSYDDPTQIVPWLARSWEVGDDARSFTFTLRNDVTFSDGTSLDADLVKRNFEILSEIPGAAGAAYLKGITEIVVEDAQTIRFEFEEPNVPFLQATSSAELGIVSAHTLDKTADQRCFEGVVGTGPFVLEEVIFNERTTFVRREGYDWASELSPKRGDAYLERIVFRVVPEAAVRNGALQSGQIDLIQSPSFDDVAALKAGGFTVERVPFLGLATHLVINTTNPILKDGEVRRALQKGIDRQDVVDLAYSGEFTAAQGVLTPNSPYFLDQSNKLAYDPDGARAILNAAGWQPGADGVREKDGQRLSITVSFYAGPANQAFTEVIQQQLRDIGVEFHLRPLVGGEFDEALLAGRYDLHRWAWSLAEADVIRSVFSTKTLNRFQLGADNPLDGLLDAQRAASNSAKREELVAEAQRVIVDEAYGLPIFNSVGLWAASPRVRGISFGPGGSGGPNLILHGVWIAGEDTSSR